MKNLTKIVALLLALTFGFTLLCACTGSEGDDTEETTEPTVTTELEETEPEVEVTFTVKVVDENGNAVSGINVQVCDDQNCFISTSNEEGIATFNSNQIEYVTSSHKLCVPFLPAAYTYEYTTENYYYLDDDMTEFTVELTSAE